MVKRAGIESVLYEIKDPEIPTLSIVDLGIVTKIEVEKQPIYVQLTPTFAGCPALKVIEDTVIEALESSFPSEKFEVETSFETQWTTDRLTPKGRQSLLEHGLAPPEDGENRIELDVLSDVSCPQCSSRNTVLKSPFGATLCRTIHYCNNCLESFEAFKPVV